MIFTEGESSMGSTSIEQQWQQGKISQINHLIGEDTKKTSPVIIFISNHLIISRSSLFYQVEKIAKIFLSIVASIAYIFMAAFMD